MPSLPLFPLGSVLLPGARLPLQLFEARYLELARALAERQPDERCFGVLLIRKGHEVGTDAVCDLYGTGCEARVDAMALAESAVGTMVHLVATGGRRPGRTHPAGARGIPRAGRRGTRARRGTDR